MTDQEIGTWFSHVTWPQAAIVIVVVWCFFTRCMP